MTYLSRLAAVLLLAAGAGTAGGDTENDRQSLKGLNGVRVVVEDLEAEVEQGGLNRTSIQTDAELKLRQVGITVLTEGEALAAPGGPILHINVSTVGGPVYAYFITVELCQHVRLDRDPSIRIFDAVTWSVGAVGTIGRSNLRDIRNSIRDHVDMFINAYLSVNPKK